MSLNCLAPTFKFLPCKTLFFIAFTEVLYLNMSVIRSDIASFFIPNLFKLSLNAFTFFLPKPSKIILPFFMVSLPESKKSDSTLLAVTGLPRASLTTSPFLLIVFN